jgi:glyoxylase I family protein
MIECSTFDQRSLATIPNVFTGIEHFAIASPDPKRLANWYVRILSFQINYEYNGNYFVKAPNGAVIEIIPSTGEQGPNSLKDPGMRHIAISVNDFDASYGELKAKGITFTAEPYESQGNKLVFFKDADGNHLHLIHRQKPLP